MKRLLLPLIVLTISFNAQAGFLIDPYVGTGSYVGAFDAANAAAEGADIKDAEESMTAVGSRLGYSFLLVSAGIDYQMATVDDESQTNISAFVGVDLPILFRFWAEYFISSDITIDNADSEFTDGYGLGVGFTGLPFVSINLEAQYLNYDLESDTGGLEYDFETVSYLLSVSLPLDF